MNNRHLPDRGTYTGTCTCSYKRLSPCAMQGDLHPLFTPDTNSFSSPATDAATNQPISLLPRASYTKSSRTPLQRLSEVRYRSPAQAGNCFKEWKRQNLQVTHLKAWHMKILTHLPAHVLIDCSQAEDEPAYGTENRVMFAFRFKRLENEDSAGVCLTTGPIDRHMHLSCHRMLLCWQGTCNQEAPLHY